MSQSEKKYSTPSAGNKYECFKALYDQEGGKLLVAQLKGDVNYCVDKIAGQYKTLTHEEFISTGAEISAKLQIIMDLTKAKDRLEAMDTPEHT